MTLLEVESVVARHGALTAVRDVSISIDKGRDASHWSARTAPARPRSLRAIAGAHAPADGHVRLDGVDITGLSAHKRVKLGIALVPEGRRLFPDMTVVENLSAARGKGCPDRGPSTRSSTPFRCSGRSPSAARRLCRAASSRRPRSAGP